MNQNPPVIAGIHICSRSVVPDDSKAVRTSEITPKVILRTSIVLLNHNIFSKFSYDDIMYNSTGMYLSSDHFSSTWNFQNSKYISTIAQNSVFAEGCSSARLKSVETHETWEDHVRATQILPRQVYHQAYLLS